MRDASNLKLIRNRQIVTHLIGRPATIIRVTQPELPVVVQPPTLHSTRRQQRTRVVGASVNRCHLHTRPKIKIDRRQNDICCVTQPELPVVVATPTLHSTVVEQRTRVKDASANRCRTSTTLKKRNFRRQIDICCVTQPELPGAVQPPTLHSTVIGQCTRVIGASVNLWGNWHVK